MQFSGEMGMQWDNNSWKKSNPEEEFKCSDAEIIIPIKWNVNFTNHLPILWFKSNYYKMMQLESLNMYKNMCQSAIKGSG